MPIPLPILDAPLGVDVPVAEALALVPVTEEPAVEADLVAAVEEPETDAEADEALAVDAETEAEPVAAPATEEVPSI